MPSAFSSVQTQSGKIFLVGGLVKDLVLKQTYRIDENLLYEEMMVMKTGRFCTPIALVNDRYILAAGGQITPSNKGNYYTNASEVYDIVTNVWTTTGSMAKPRGNTSMTAIGNFVFIFQGLLPQLQASQTSAMEFINLGSCAQQSLRNAVWEQTTVQNPDFVNNEPRGSHLLGNNEIIVFGGTGNFTYSVDVSTVVLGE